MSIFPIKKPRRFSLKKYKRDHKGSKIERIMDEWITMGLKYDQQDPNDDIKEIHFNLYFDVDKQRFLRRNE